MLYDKIIGKGVYGTVNLVYINNNKYACKNFNDEPTFIKSIHKELHVLKMMNNKDNIIQCFNLNDPNYFNNKFVILEFCDFNLYKFHKNNFNKIFNFYLINNFSIQILNGLKFIHQYFIHADLKPENILVINNSNNNFILKICDFGLSLDNKFYSNITVQSLYYRAPEVVFGIKFNNSIDIWSFACILFELSSGFPLFNEKIEYNHAKSIIEYLGLPNNYSTYTKSYIYDEFFLKFYNEYTKKYKFNILQTFIDNNFKIYDINIEDFDNNIFLSVYQSNHIIKIINNILIYDHKLRPNAEKLYNDFINLQTH